MPSVLCLDDEPGIREYLADVLTGAGYEVVTAVDATDALARLEDRPFDVAVLDLRMPGGRGGMDVLRRARATTIATKPRSSWHDQPGLAGGLGIPIAFMLLNCASMERGDSFGGAMPTSKIGAGCQCSTRGELRNGYNN